MNDPGNMLMDKSLRSVFVGNIPYEATEEKLKDIFNQAGSVGWCPFTSAFLSTSYFLRASSFPHSVEGSIALTPSLLQAGLRPGDGEAEGLRLLRVQGPGDCAFRHEEP